MVMKISFGLCFLLVLFIVSTCSFLGSVDHCIHSSPAKSAFVRKENTVERCSRNDISVYQYSTGPLPNGIPTYTVQVVNECNSSACKLSDVHVKCEAFASYQLINPSVFRRIAYDDSLVKNGEPLAPGEVVTFVYSNTFCYPLTASSANCS